MSSKGNAKANTLVVFGDSLSDNGNLFDLAGYPPSPPYWDGRASNGPTYAEQLARALHDRLDDRAFVGAQASDSNPGALTDPAGNSLPINLPTQIASYLADLAGHAAPRSTTAVINIGANDYTDFLFFSDQTTPPHQIVANVLGAVAGAVDALTHAGVSRIALFTLPDLSETPRYADPAIPAEAAVAAHDLILANNAGIRQIAAEHPNVVLVDQYALLGAVATDAHAFGFTAPLDAMLRDEVVAGSGPFAPNEVAFFDEEHPTYAGHGVLAAFADAVLTSSRALYLDGSKTDIHLGSGDTFVFAEALDPAKALSGNYSIHGGTGDDLIVAGSGNVSVAGGCGNDIIISGSGSSCLAGGDGTDVLATNSLAQNVLSGGEGDDTLIANRGGDNSLRGGSGSDLIVIKENQGLLASGGGFAFGHQVIDGGSGTDTLRFVINDQSDTAKQAFMTEFLKVEASFDFARAHHLSSFTVDGMTVAHVERIELQVDSVSQDPATPYLITHTVALADGAPAPHETATMQHMLHTVEQWGLLTV